MQIRNIYITKNSPYEQTFTVKNANGTPINITGYQSNMFLAKHYESVSKVTVVGTVQDAVNGVIRMAMSSVETSTLPAGNMVYSIFVTPPEGQEMVLVQGLAIVEPSVHG